MSSPKVQSSGLTNTEAGVSPAILQVAPSDQAGGAERIALDLHTEYLRRGYDAWLAVGQKETETTNVLAIEPEHPRALSRMMAHMRGLYSRVSCREQYAYPATGRLLDLPPRRPSILHCHNVPGGYFDLRQIPRLSHQVPMILTLHDERMFSGMCHHPLDCTQWKTGCGYCGIPRYLRWLRRRGIGRNWRKRREIYAASRLYIAAPSRWLTDKATRSILAEGIVESRVIPHGVDLDVFKPGSKVEARGRLGLSEAANVLLFVGQRFGSNIYKDFATLRRAVRIIGREMPVLLLAVGDEGRVEHHGKAEIRYVSYVEDKRAMADYYRAADVYVHAARVETFPTTVLEALACGTPVAAASVGGVPEQITDGHNGLLVPPQEPQAMAKQTLQLLRNRELRETMSHSAVVFAREHYDIRTEAQRYLDWYEELLVPAERTT